MIPQVDLFSFVFWKNLKTPKRHFEINWPLVGSIHSCVSSLKHIHFAIINHFLFNCNVSKMAAHSERKTQTANFRAVQNFAKSNWQETAQLHTFAHSVTSTSLFLEFFFSAESVCADLANGRLTFEDDLRSGGLLHSCNYIILALIFGCKPS